MQPTEYCSSPEVPTAEDSAAPRRCCGADKVETGASSRALGGGSGLPVVGGASTFIVARCDRTGRDRQSDAAKMRCTSTSTCRCLRTAAASGCRDIRRRRLRAAEWSTGNRQHHSSLRGAGRSLHCIRASPVMRSAAAADATGLIGGGDGRSRSSASPGSLPAGAAFIYIYTPPG